MKIPSHAKLILIYLLYIFGLNFAWESLQMFFYENHTASFINFVFVHVKASLGDVLIFGIIYTIGLAIFQNRAWFLEKRLATYILSMICGFTLAVIIEKYALVTGRWSYDNLMPVIPFFNVGLSPVLQMIILPIIFSISITKILNLQK